MNNNCYDLFQQGKGSMLARLVLFDSIYNGKHALVLLFVVTNEAITVTSTVPDK